MRNKIYYSYFFDGKYFEYHVSANREDAKRHQSMSRRFHVANPEMTAEMLAKAICEIEQEVELYGAIRA